jgi:phosphoribosyl 1,2-cyclic phosphodiesterase
MRFCSLGSGSAGNATVVEAAGSSGVSRVLIDCGFSLKETELRMRRAGLEPGELNAIFVTHEHGDHIGCAVALARRYGIALWMSRGTWRAIGEPDVPGLLGFARDGVPIAVGAIELRPYTVPHDALEPLQLSCSAGDVRLGLLTDVGCITSHLVAHLQGCDALVLECNHDRGLLEASNYPRSLKARVGGRFGHLANDSAAEILSACMHNGLQTLVAAHLSAQNNTPDLVRRALAQAWDDARGPVVVADAAAGCPWITVGG